MAFCALKKLALAASLLSSVAGSQAQQAGGTAPPTVPTRPAPVSGRVVVEPAPAAPRMQAISTARAVPPPADVNEPFLTPAEAALHAPPGASSSHPVKHRDHTVGKKKVAQSEGKKKSSKRSGKRHVDKAGEGVKKGASKLKAAPKDKNQAAKKKVVKKKTDQHKRSDKAVGNTPKAKATKQLSKKKAPPALVSASGEQGGKRRNKPVDKRKTHAVRPPPHAASAV